MITPKGFTPRFVLTRTLEGRRLRTLSVDVALPDAIPDGPTRADVVIRQLADDTWQLQDRRSEPLASVVYDDVREARAHAARLADTRGGCVWLRSDRPPRLERR